MRKASNNLLRRSHSLPESFPTLEDIYSNLSFEFSLFRTKLESFVPETIFDESILQPHILAHKLVILDSYEDVVHQFEKLEYIVTQLNQPAQKPFVVQ